MPIIDLEDPLKSREQPQFASDDPLIANDDDTPGGFKVDLPEGLADADDLQAAQDLRTVQNLAAAQQQDAALRGGNPLVEDTVTVITDDGEIFQFETKGNVIDVEVRHPSDPKGPPTDEEMKDYLENGPPVINPGGGTVFQPLPPDDAGFDDGGV